MAATDEKLKAHETEENRVRKLNKLLEELEARVAALEAAAP